MSFLVLSELLVISLFVYVIGTQVILPLWRGAPLFPILISQRRKLEHRLVDAGEDVVEARLERAIHDKRDRAASIKSSTKKGR